MSEEMRQALALIDAHPSLADFVGPRSEALVVAAEALVGTTFPPSYRQFLLELGMGNFGDEEFAGIIDDRFQPLWPDAVGIYLKDLGEALPPRYFAFYSWGDGTVSALDLDRRDADGEAPVVSCHDGRFAAAPIEDEAPTFGAFFLARLRGELG